MSNFWTAAEAREHSLFALNLEAQQQQQVLDEIKHNIETNAAKGQFCCYYHCPIHMAEWAKEFLESKCFKVTDFKHLNGIETIFYIDWSIKKNDSTR